ncbi:MAG: hypothetical protein PHN88_11310 [Ignavibacteria bacterium]|nr:hypothetical protein [Ignavibacteria bacterium]
MRTLRIILFTALFASFSLISSAQIKNTPKKTEPDKRNNWAIGFMYTDNGFGVAGTYFKPIGRTSDLTFKLSISGVTDPSEVEYYDIYGNSYIKDKINRVFLTTLSVGIKQNIFYDEIDGSFRPFLKAGIAPAFAMTTPFDRSYFKAFGYAQPGFAFGGYAGLGIEYYESKSIGLSISAEYYYLPVIGREIKSLKDKPINNLGGIQLNFNFMFLH